MAPPTSSPSPTDAGIWAVDRAVSLPEVWALVAAFRGLVGAWRLLGVCRAARVGAKEFLGSLPRLVVFGGYSTRGGGTVSEVWGLDLATMRWEAMAAHLFSSYDHACCAVRGAAVVLGGYVSRVGTSHGASRSPRVEMLSKGAGAFEELPPLSCGAISGAAAIAVDGTHSASGQVLLLGGRDQDHTTTSSVRLVDLATGICTPQADLLNARSNFAAARLPDGGIICAGGIGGLATAEMWAAPMQGALEAAWTWRGLPAMSVGRIGCSGCVLSDGRFAVLGGDSTGGCTSSCEALTLGDDEHWLPLSTMCDPRANFACAAVAGCIIVAGGYHQRKSAEVYDEVLGRWLRLPYDLPHDGGLHSMGSTLL
jgi:hypothetical protein